MPITVRTRAVLLDFPWYMFKSVNTLKRFSSSSSPLESVSSKSLASGESRGRSIGAVMLNEDCLGGGGKAVPCELSVVFSRDSRSSGPEDTCPSFGSGVSKDRRYGASEQPRRNTNLLEQGFDACETVLEASDIPDASISMCIELTLRLVVGRVSPKGCHSSAARDSRRPRPRVRGRETYDHVSEWDSPFRRPKLG